MRIAGTEGGGVPAAPASGQQAAAPFEPVSDESGDAMTQERDARQERRYRIAFAGIAMLMLGIVVTLPFSLASIVDDVVGSARGAVLPLLRVPPSAIAPDHSRLHVAVTHLDEVQLLATLRVSGHHVCEAACPLEGPAPPRVGHPGRWVTPKACRHRWVSCSPQTSAVVSESIQLPVAGVPIRYQFDRYHLDLGIALQRVYPDGRVVTVGPERDPPPSPPLDPGSASAEAYVAPPSPWTRAAFGPRAGRWSMQQGAAVYFERPRYLRVLAVLLVLLIGAAAAYSVLLRPPEDLIVNSGALVLGVWGVRAILVPIEASLPDGRRPGAAPWSSCSCSAAFPRRR